MTGRSLLLVEDNPDDVALMLRAFRLNSMTDEVHVARDGAEALGRLLPSPGSPDALAELPAVVLLDLKLPKIDGFGVLRRMRAEARTALVPVVILTSSNEPVDLLDSYRLGANSFVRKPVSFGDLVIVTRRIAGYWLGVNEVPEQADRSARSTGTL